MGTNKELRDFHTDRFEIGDKIFIYDFNRIPHHRLERAVTFASVSNQIQAMPPETLLENKILTAHANSDNFWRNIFIEVRKDGEGNEIEVLQNEANYEPIIQAAGKDLYKRKEVCRTDFFMHTGIIDQSKMMQLKNMLDIIGTKDGKTKEILEEAGIASGSDATSSGGTSTPSATSSKKKAGSKTTT